MMHGQKNIKLPQQLHTYLLVWCFLIKHRNSVPYLTEDYFKNVKSFVSQYQNFSVELVLLFTESL